MRIRVLTVHPALPAETRCADEIDIDDRLAEALIRNGDVEAIATTIEAEDAMQPARPRGKPRKGA